MIDAPAPFTGLILAGGLGRRMGGSEKALVPLHGRPLIAHVVERLRPQVAEVLVNANAHAERYASFGDRVVADRIEGHLGPLAGLHAGLCAARTQWVLAVPCDAPRLPLDLARRLLEGLKASDAEVAIASADGRPHPVFCLLPVALGPDLAEHLRGDGRAVMGWMQSRRLAVVEFEDVAAFTNVNTAEELARLEAQSFPD